MSFPAYHGLTLKMHIGDNTIDAKWAFGLGTGDANITGIHYLTKFPEYGSAGSACLSSSGLTPCRGKGLLYVLFYVPLDQIVGGIRNFPKFVITNTGKFPGTQCNEDNLYWNYRVRKWYWLELGISAKPRDGVLTFKPAEDWIETLQPGEFAVVGFHCY